MPDAAEILARLRHFGANLAVEDKGLRIINPGKLPRPARDYIAKHRLELVELLNGDHHVAKEERAAIIEFDGRTPRQWADQFATILFTTRPPGISELDWSWFVCVCGRMIDECPEGSAS